MPLIHSYAIWNNKGGVGKSTITFHLAMRYAELNSNKKVLVLDLCPQSNSSLMLLGGGSKGEEYVMEFCSMAQPRSIVGYLSAVITNGPGASLPLPRDYLVQVQQYNDNAPANLFLVCGDGNLEPLSPAINDAAERKQLTPKSRPWKWTQEIVKDFIDNLVNSTKEEWMVFIDTNPSFSIYTQIAISGAERILVPINADDSSKNAASAMMALLHGTVPPHPIYGTWTYAERAKKQDIQVPSVYLLIGNRLTQFEGPAAAFAAISDATAESLFNIYIKNKSYFVDKKREIKTKQDFIKEYSMPLRDFNTAGVVCAHLGMRLSTMRQAYYKVYGIDVKVNSERISECIAAIDAIVSIL